VLHSAWDMSELYSTRSICREILGKKIIKEVYTYVALHIKVIGKKKDTINLEGRFYPVSSET